MEGNLGNFFLLLGLRLASVQLNIVEAQVGETCLHRLMQLISGLLTVDEQPVKLKVEAIVEAATHVPAPVEEEPVEGLRLEHLGNQHVAHVRRDHVHDLVEQPEDRRSRRAVIERQKHVDTLHEEGPVKVGRDLEVALGEL